MHPWRKMSIRSWWKRAPTNVRTHHKPAWKLIVSSPLFCRPHKRDFGHKGYPPMNPVGGPPGYYGHPWGKTLVGFDKLISFFFCKIRMVLVQEWECRPMILWQWCRWTTATCQATILLLSTLLLTTLQTCRLLTLEPRPTQVPTLLTRCLEVHIIRITTVNIDSLWNVKLRGLFYRTQHCIY